jgi:hypothetical protein
MSKQNKLTKKIKILKELGREPVTTGAFGKPRKLPKNRGTK